MKSKFISGSLILAACMASYFVGWMQGGSSKAGTTEKSDQPKERQITGVSGKPDTHSRTGAQPDGSERSLTTYASLLGPPTAEEKAKSPVERVKAAFAETNEFRRLQLFWRALTELKPEDAQGIQDLFDEGDRLGRHYPAEYQYFARRWGEVDGAAAVAYGVQAWQNRGGMEGMMSRMAAGWASQKPEQAVDWLNANTGGPPWMQEAVMDGLLDGLADKNLDLARRLVEDRADDPRAEHYFRELADKYIYNKSLNEAEKWFDTLDTAKVGKSKARLLDHLTDRYLRGGPEQASAFLDRHPDQITVDSAIRIGFELSQLDPAQAKTWVAALPERVRTPVAENLTDKTGTLLMK